MLHSCQTVKHVGFVRLILLQHCLLQSLDSKLDALEGCLLC